MKKPSLVPAAAIALSIAVVFASATAAQAPPAAGSPPPEGASHAPRNYPAPTNLKVLPKDLTGKQVHEIMEGWAGDLGVHCDNCHAADPKNIGPNGKPRLNFADDSKDEKQMARIMYTMMETDKKDYVAKVAAMDKMDEPAAPLTCGTCHRGHQDPEKFTPAPEHGPLGMPGNMPGMQH
ncbi:MAG: c-type cytochrome [Terracidiphilus sp.]